ncbi:hypothetical protein Taro_033406 [Colocasia esculenta]|uniref:FAD-binding domain-containing protein n=1 Tax=Colocasia esculenta TaxID=4460 RepID=A0A843W026_COLES|nr:hypothetical protein [Colocasia esculenta]
MAAGCLPAPLLSLHRPSPLSLLRSRSPLFRVGCPRRRASSVVASAPGGGVRREEVVVVGAGIAGLATAVSLARLGVRSLVLEQGDSLRTGGTSLTLFKNGWRVLDAIGVGDDLRPQFLEIQGCRELNSLMIVIGCDGVRSPVAKWMGFSNPNYVGHCAFRGLALYPEGQPFEHKVNYIYGRGLRAGYVPVSTSKVYWFICFNSPSPGPRTNDPNALKEEAQELVKAWPSELVDIITRTPESSVIKTPLVDRWLWPLITPPASVGGAVVVGDAWHPMTPNLGQGACCALEDSVILATKLASAITGERGDVTEAFDDYSRERWSRVFPMTIRANLVGSLLQWDNPVVCAVRDSIVIPKLVKLGPLLEHTNFDFESLKPGSAM